MWYNKSIIERKESKELPYLLPHQLDLSGKRIIYRAPFDIEPTFKDKKPVIQDKARLEVGLQTLKYLLDQKCTVIIMNKVGRPEGEYDAKLSNKPHAEALQKLIKQEVHFHPFVPKNELSTLCTQLKNEKKGEGSLHMLDNLRFYPEEEDNDAKFAEILAGFGDLMVFDDFPEAHRKHASVTGLMTILETISGYYFDSEYKNLKNLLEEPLHPFTVVLGGAKLIGKLEALRRITTFADHLILGGIPANYFMKLKRIDIGASPYGNPNRRYEELADDIINNSSEKLVLPTDVIVETKAGKLKKCLVRDLGKDDIIVDLGKDSVKLIENIVKNSKTLFWNGPLGVCDRPVTSHATEKLAVAVSKIDGVSIVGGGDTHKLLTKLTPKVHPTFMSLGGGSSLTFLAEGTLPVLPLLHIWRNKIIKARGLVQAKV